MPVLYNKPTNAHQQNIFYFMLIFTDMFRSLLRPSSGCHTRIQTIYRVFHDSWTLLQEVIS